MANSMMLLLHARGYGSIWRTGRFTESERVRRLFGLGQDERLLGWLYIGTPALVLPRGQRVLDDVSDRVSVFTPEPVTS
jgi:nitroreductase